MSGQKRPFFYFSNLYFCKFLGLLDWILCKFATRVIVAIVARVQVMRMPKLAQRKSFT